MRYESRGGCRRKPPCPEGSSGSRVALGRAALNGGGVPESALALLGLLSHRHKKLALQLLNIHLQIPIYFFPSSNPNHSPIQHQLHSSSLSRREQLRLPYSLLPPRQPTISSLPISSQPWRPTRPRPLPTWSLLTCCSSYTRSSTSWTSPAPSSKFACPPSCASPSPTRRNDTAST